MPLLRKDFIVTEYQLRRSGRVRRRRRAADRRRARRRELRALVDRAAGLGLATLVEVHDRPELARAVDAGADIIGVNSRNLRTLTVDRDVLERIWRVDAARLS